MNNPDWNYKGDNGPENWWRLSPENLPCKEGKSQSPVDISKVNETPREVVELSYNYSRINIINNGCTIMVNYEQGSNAVIGAEKFKLLQFHFHTPAEHTINGRRYAMEMHLVHNSADEKIMVLGVLFNPGKFNPELQKLIDNFPKEINIPAVNEEAKISVLNLLPGKKAYYHYSGSLTTPPCTEGVNWYIFSSTVEASRGQIDKFKIVMGKNARPVQPLNNRTIIKSC